MRHRTKSCLTLVLASLLGAAVAGPSVAQPYAPFLVPDDSLDSVLVSAGADYEDMWNSLLVSELRASLAGADSAVRLADLERRVAVAEERVLGSRIGSDALASRAKWSKAAQRRRVAAAVSESLGVVARGARRSSEADSLYRVALAHYRALGERRRAAWTLGSLGAVALTSGRPQDADSLNRLALAARRELNDARMIGNALNDIGLGNLLMQRYDEAYRFLQDARRLRVETGQRLALAGTLNYLGLVYSTLGRADSAGYCYREAFEITEAYGDTTRMLRFLINYGKVLIDQGLTDQAIPVYTRAAPLARARGDLANEAVIQNNLGEALRASGRYTEAIERYEIAVRLDEQAGDVQSLAFHLTGLGRGNLIVGDAEGARSALERSLALSDSLGDPSLQAMNLNNLSIAAALLDDKTGAQRLALRALEAAEAAADSERIHDAAASLGALAFEEDRLDEAERWFSRAVAAGEQLGVEQRAIDRLWLGVTWIRSGRLEEAEREQRRVLQMGQESGSTSLVSLALLNLGDIAERRADYPGALSHYRRALALVDTLRTRQSAERQSISLFAHRLYQFEAVIHLLGKLDPLFPDSGYAAEAFAYAERARARAFLDLVAASGTVAEPPRLLTLGETQGLLSDREALIEYSLGDSSSSMWVIRRGSWKRFELPPRKTFRRRVSVLRRGLGDPSAAESPRTREAQRDLHRMLIEPAEPMLEGVKHVVLSPDGLLNLVPFETLLAREATGERIPRGAYLVERFAISYAPSASALATRRGGDAASSVIAVGDPFFGEGSAPGAGESGTAPEASAFERLPDTAAEVEALRSMAGSRSVVALTRAEASRDRLLALPGLAQAQVIHIATHGEANEIEPERSALILAPDPGGREPSRLTVPDIMALRLQASQVTLSACETGLGRLERGEGVIGLTRAFLAAGAQSVMVSLWKVNDRSTAMLMEGFYRGVLEKRKPRAEALAEAKRKLLEKPETRSPFYWAPFVLVGEAGRL